MTNILKYIASSESDGGKCGGIRMQHLSLANTLKALTIAVDWTNGNVQSVTLGGSRTLTFTDGQDRGKYDFIYNG